MKKLTIRIPQDRGTLYERIQYPAGEIQVRLTKRGLEACRRKDSYEIICNPIPDLIELAQLKDALDGYGALQEMGEGDGQSYWFQKHLFLPYMPYARADRVFVKGDCHGLAVWGHLINSLGFNTVWTFDVHSNRAHRLVDNLANLCPTDRPVDQIGPIIRKLGRKGLALVIPDQGASKRYELDRYSLPIIQGLKVRDPKTGKLTGFGIAFDANDSRGKAIRARKALIVDDLCDGGGTFIGLAQALLGYNPDLRLYLYVSHGIFSKGQKELRKYFQDIYVSQYSFKATT